MGLKNGENPCAGGRCAGFRSNTVFERSSPKADGAKSREAANLPAVEFVGGNDFFKAVVRARKPFKDYSRIEKLQVCREHCVLKFVLGEPMTRESLSRRFGLEAKDGPVVGRILRAAVEARLIKPCEAAAGPRLRRYVPDWA